MPPGPSGRHKQTQRVETQAFPMMDLDHIVTILHELNVHSTAQDLLKPSPTSVQYLWLQILENLTGASVDMLEQPKYELLNTMEYQVCIRRRPPETLLTQLRRPTRTACLCSFSTVTGK